MLQLPSPNASLLTRIGSYEAQQGEEREGGREEREGGRVGGLRNVQGLFYSNSPAFLALT